eukprot:TRINITY_DN102696_c0_g1_i1.p1 TRINITY_DN102696_c0_g1~~TRINITY_DN102696_c0_g1_i1.p1  ORF type:complete len:931 (-),score=142.35 TRINITY_DN102696_c0_g1_i1:187-2604(-)
MVFEDSESPWELNAWDSSRFFEALWEAWTFMADPGTHSPVTMPWARTASALISVSGILFWSSVLGLTVDVITAKMEALRAGKSRIIEKDHTLILGWTEKTIHIIEELCAANESEGGGVVAVLAPESKTDMESQLEYQLPARRRKGTRVVFRSGSPLVVSDLSRVSMESAKAIIILATPGSADQADADTLRTMLSIRSSNCNLLSYVVAEVRDIDNEPLVKLVGGPSVETMVSHDMIGRLMLMSVRQPGLAKVYEGLLGFEGDEFYMNEWPELEGVEFGELAERFPDAVPIGIKSESGKLMLHPPINYELKEGDQVVVIAEDNDTYKPEPANKVDVGQPPDGKPVLGEPEKILFCGWRRDIRDVLQLLDKIVQPGSEVHMMTHCVPLDKRNERLLDDGLDVRQLMNLSIVHQYGNTSVRRKIAKLPISEYNCCMIFADEAFELDTLHADSHSLATLLLIRDLQCRNNLSPFRSEAHQSESSNFSSGSPKSPKRHGKGNGMSQLTKSRATCPMICEILDPHTQNIISSNDQLGLTSDFCQSNKLTAQVLAMVAEERTVNQLINELLGNSGCEIAVVCSSRYAHPDEVISFMTLSRRASLFFDELVVGYQMKESIEKTVLNPAEKWRGCRWDNHDLAILRRTAKARASVIRRTHVAPETSPAAPFTQGSANGPLGRLIDTLEVISEGSESGEPASLGLQESARNLSLPSRQKISKLLKEVAVFLEKGVVQSDEKERSPLPSNACANQKVRASAKAATDPPGEVAPSMMTSMIGLGLGTQTSSARPCVPPEEEAISGWSVHNGVSYENM